MQGSLPLQQWQRGHLSLVTYQPPSASKKPSWVFISRKSATAALSFLEEKNSLRAFQAPWKAIKYSFPEFFHNSNSESQDFHCHRQSGVGLGWNLSTTWKLIRFLFYLQKKLVLPWGYNLKPNNSLMVHILVSQKNHHYWGSFCFSYFWEKWKFSMSPTFLGDYCIFGDYQQLLDIPRSLVSLSFVWSPIPNEIRMLN